MLISFQLGWLTLSPHFRLGWVSVWSCKVSIFCVWNIYRRIDNFLGLLNTNFKQRYVLGCMWCGSIALMFYSSCHLKSTKYFNMSHDFFFIFSTCSSCQKTQGKKPKRPCYFCGQAQTQLLRHLKTVHKHETIVKQAMTLPKAERTKAFNGIKKKGIMKRNIELKSEGKELLRERRQGSANSIANI